MEFGWTVLWFIIAMGLLVTVHEFGHFWVARKLGFKVLRFSVGFGKPLFKKIGRAPDHTEYVIAMLPLGWTVPDTTDRTSKAEVSVTAVAPTTVATARLRDWPIWRSNG